MDKARKEIASKINFVPTFGGLKLQAMFVKFSVMSSRCSMVIFSIK